MTENEISFEEKTQSLIQAMKYAEDLTALYKKERAQRRELETSHRKIRTLMDSMSDGMIGMDENFVINEFNPMACRILYLPEQDLAGKHIFSLLKNPEFAEMMSEVRKHPEKRNISIDISRNLSLGISLSPLPENKGYVLVIRDITAWKRAENMKGEFLNILSHELRTPLSGIIGFVDILNSELRGHFNETQKEFMALLRESVNRMRKTVEELLHLAQLKSTEPNEGNEEILLEMVLSYVVSELEPEAGDRNISLRFDQWEEKSPVIGTWNMLRELFYHVIRNAVVFGREGGHVRVGIAAQDRQYEIWVEDDGIGIPEKDLEKIFQSFYQVEDHLTRSREGLGLGLTIARHVAEMHGGSIRMESTLGQGSRCVIRLPFPPNTAGSPQ